MGKVIAVSNQKGGVGKTTTCVNLAASVSTMGRNCLLIDLDPQGNSTSGLGIEKKDLRTNVYHVILGQSSFVKIIQSTELTKLFIAPANIDLVGLEVEFIKIKNKEYKLKNAIADIKYKYDFIFIDCPPSLNILTINALTAADSVLIPLQCEFYAMEGITQLFSTINEVKKKLNFDLTIEGILPTMYDVRNNISSQVIEEARNYFSDYVFNTVIPRNVRLSEAPSYGKPALLCDRESKGSISYLKLANEILSK